MVPSSAGGSGDGVEDPDRERERARVRLAIWPSSVCDGDGPTAIALHSVMMRRMNNDHLLILPVFQESSRSKKDPGRGLGSDSVLSFSCLSEFPHRFWV